jgi:hypothetical protein
VSERAVAAAKSGVGMITSVAKSLWGNYIAPTASSSRIRFQLTILGRGCRMIERKMLVLGWPRGWIDI